MKFFLFLFLVINLYAASATKEYSFRVGYGLASENDLGEIVFGDFGTHPRDLSVYALDGGYLLQEGLSSWPIDFYVKGGVSYFNEDTFSNTYEMTLYIKAYYNIDFYDNRVRIGAAEGISYTLHTLETEYYEAIDDGEVTSKFLNYLDLSVDFDFGRAVGSKLLEDTYIGYALKHRSGVFGLYNGVHGGSNYNTFYLEKNF